MPIQRQTTFAPRQKSSTSYPAVARWRVQQMVRAMSFVALFCMLSLFIEPLLPTIYSTAMAQGEGTPIIPDKPQIPATPVPIAEPKLIILSHYTEPEQIRANEPFELHLQFKNVGILPAIDFFVKNTQCTTQFASEDQCVKPISRVEVNQEVWVVLHLRWVGTDKTASVQVLQLDITNDLSTKTAEDILTQVEIGIHLLPERVITDVPSSLERPFNQPDIVIHRSWTAKPRSTVAELLTPVPLLLSNSPLLTDDVGGPEFELAVELQNLGSAEATNIFIDFCHGGGVNPVGSSCRKYVPTTLRGGELAVASQTLAANNVNTLRRGQSITVEISYDFRYADQWVTERVTPTIFLYPQEQPAPLIPEVTVNIPYMNIRNGPGTFYDLIGVARYGTRFTVTGVVKEPEHWWRVIYQPGDHGNGWLYAPLVVASAIDGVPLVINVPAPPPTPTPSQKPEEGSLLDGAAVAANAAGTQSNNGISASTVSTEQPDNDASPAMADAVIVNEAHSTPVEFTLVNTGQTVLEKSDASRPFALGSAGPRIVIERYQTIPEQPLIGQPFRLELTLRNVGSMPARQLLLGWYDSQILPVGIGSIQWLDTLDPGATVDSSGQFVATANTLDELTKFSVQLQYLGLDEQAIVHTESITLIWGHAGALPPIGDPPMLDATTVETMAPLWWRILLGLAGLGAESK